jgi:hypothetical protein
MKRLVFKEKYTPYAREGRQKLLEEVLISLTGALDIQRSVLIIYYFIT